MSRVPYTTPSGLKIGLRYQQPTFHRYCPDMDRVQTAFLGRGKPLTSRRWIVASVIGAAVYVAIMASALL